jgi:hypothetical protein
MTLMSLERTKATLYELNQNIGGRLAPFEFVPPQQLMIDEETTITAPWQRINFEISQFPVAYILDDDLFGALNFPGAVLESLARKNHDFTIRGFIYASVSD